MKIAVIGVGLIGGSLALKLRDNFAEYIYGVDQSDDHIKEAVSRGIIDVGVQLEEAISQSTFVIIAVPVDVTLKILPQILDLCTEHHTVIDVGSTKSAIVNSVVMHPLRKRFVASHPMWGTENSGPAAATSEAFTGRAAVICDAENSAQDALEVAMVMYQKLGMNVLNMSAKIHDIHTAYISHISHITSYALANTVLEKEHEENTIFQLASSGFSSTVRLAKSHPEMWVPIFLQNKDNILDVLKEHISQLQNFENALQNSNTEDLEQLISNANKIRAILK